MFYYVVFRYFVAATISISNFQEIEANFTRLVKKLRFYVILGVSFKKNLTFLTMMRLSLLVRLFSVKYIINANLIDEGNLTTTNI